MDGKQLKNSILQWAIQGKLVPQNPKDEPAQKLLERIASARHSERSEESSKRSKKTSKNPTSRIYRENGVWYEQVGNAEPKDISEDIPFEIPENWAWCRIDDISSLITDGEHKTPRRISSYAGFYLLSARNVLDGSISLNKVDYVDEAEYNQISKRCNPQKNDVLISCSGSVGRSTVVNDDNKYAMVRSAAMIRTVGVMPLFVMYGIQSPFLQQQIVLYSKQTAQANLFLGAIKQLLLPLPPLAEQKRIVAKLEQVLPLADEYGVAQEELDKLNKELPEALKKSILQQAIQGKLVHQNPKDEPAQKLLEKIRKEKEVLVEQGKLKKKDLECNPIDEDEIPFELPENWVWCRLEDIIWHLSDGTHKTPKYTDSGIPFISVKNMSSGKLSFENTKFVTKTESDILNQRCNPQKGDLLLSKVGTTGIPVIVDVDIQFSLFVSLALIKFFPNLIDSSFLVYLLKSPLVQDQVKEHTRGVGNKNWVLNDISRTVIALPPLAEQKRIVTKLEQLFKVL